MKILESNGNFVFKSITDTHDKLPVGIYLLAFDKNNGEYFLKRQPEFKLPAKLYGDNSVTERWKRSYETNSEKNLGILLSGLKGTGKTILAKKFCQEMEMPVILITEEFEDDDFIAFLANPAIQNSVVFIDEFEKVYTTFDSQKHFLTLMDGVFETKLIFLMTTNSVNLDRIFFNRLNRIKYHKVFSDMDDTIVEEIIKDMLVNQEHAQSLRDVIAKIDLQSYDIIISIIKEMNLFNEDANVCVEYLNVAKEIIKYDVYEIYKKKKISLGTQEVKDKAYGRIYCDRPLELYEKDGSAAQEKIDYRVWINFAHAQLTPTDYGFELVQDKMKFEFHKVKFFTFLDA